MGKILHISKATVINILLFRYVEDMSLHKFLLVNDQLCYSLQVDGQNAHELTENWIYSPLELDCHEGFVLEKQHPGDGVKAPESSTLPGAGVIRYLKFNLLE